MTWSGISTASKQKKSGENAGDAGVRGGDEKRRGYEVSGENDDNK